MDEPSNSSIADVSSTPSGSNSGPPRKSLITSCAECRRLKLRCDRVFPCSSCIRRGCANLCPTGTLEKGKRGFLKRLEQSLPSAKPGVEGEPSEVAMFVARDNAMTKRIQELEAALTAAGVSVPGTAAPVGDTLAQENEGRAKRPRTEVEAESVGSGLPLNASSSSMAVDATDDGTLGLGTLTIDGDKRSRYVGASAGAAYLPDLWKRGQTHSRRNSEDRSTSSFSDIGHGLNGSVANRSVSPQQVEINTKMGCLPRYDEAVRITNLYFKNASFMYEAIPEEIFFNIHLPAVYPDRGHRPYVPTNLHSLAVLSMVLALGAFFDLSQSTEVVRPLSVKFYELAVAALNISIPLKLDTIPAVQTLHLMALYFLSTQGENGGESAWQLLGMAMRSIQAQGMHRDGARWELPQQDLEERRRVFWETQMYDRLQAFTFGRPYSMSDSHHDCEMPQSCDTPLPCDTDPANSTFSHTRWHMYKFRFSRLLGHIVDLVFSATHPSYSVIQSLDREINAHYDALPEWIISDAVKNPIKELPAHGLGAESDQRKDAQIASLANMYFLALLHLHRGPFCRALMLGSKNLGVCKYKSSVESLTGAARAIINNARGLFALHPAITSRMWYFIFHSFTAAVCLAVFVIVAPSHPLAPAAYASMLDAVELFTRADGERARDAAERMSWLAARARQAMGARDLELAPTQETQSSAGDEGALPRMEFPTSNMRGNPEDLLGTSTKLVRAQLSQLPDGLASPIPSPLPPSPAMPAGLSQHHPIPISGSRFQFEQTLDSAPDHGYPRAGQDQWSAPHSEQLSSMAMGQNPMVMDWRTDSAIYGGNSLSGGGGTNTRNAPPHQLHHETHPYPPYHQPPQYFDPSPYVSSHGFDVGGFLVRGANPWMFDSAASETEAEKVRPSRPLWD